MTLIYCNSFGQYTQGYGIGSSLIGEDILSAPGNPGIVAIETGRNMFLYGGGTYGNSTAIQLPSSLTTIIIGFRGWQMSQRVGCGVIGFYDNTTQMLNLATQGSGWGLWNGGTKILDTQYVSTQGGNDHWMIKIVFGNTDGEAYMYRNGILVASGTGLDTIAGGTECDRLYLLGPGDSGGHPVGISDLWVDDANLLGERKVVYEPCDTAGSQADFTPTGDTTNEDCVDEYQPDGDTTYNTSSTPSDKDQLAHSEGTSLPASLDLVQVIARARKEDANDGQVKLGCLQATTEVQGSAKTLTTSYQWFYDLFPNDPDTGTVWDPGDEATAESTYENVSIP